MSNLTLVSSCTPGTAAATPHYLYIMRDADNPTEMKVGIAADVICRAKQLPDNIDFPASRAYQFPTKALAAGAEATLHALLTAKGFHRPKSHRKQGWTEWFDVVGSDLVEVYLATNQSLLDWTGPISMMREIPWLERCVGEAELAFQYAALMVKKAILRGAISRTNLVGLADDGLMQGVGVTLYVDPAKIHYSERSLWMAEMPGYYTRKGNTSLRDAKVLTNHKLENDELGINLVALWYHEQPLAHPGEHAQVVKAREEFRSLLASVPETSIELETKIEAYHAALSKERKVAA